jgi:Zn-dependent protease with chaperone function
MTAKELRIPRERTLFGISAIFSAVVWLALSISLIGILYAALIGLFVLCAHCMLMAHLMGNGVRIGPKQLPDLWARVDAASRKLGLAATPEAYVVQSGGILNAFATKILSRRFIILYSDLIEAFDRDLRDLGGLGDGGPGQPNELDFVIGHELGHVATGHLSFRLFLLPARILPLIGAAYSRACEYTCDRCGHEVVGDLAVSSRALAILAAGPRTARRLDLDAFVEQRAETRRFWMAVYELNATHPFLSKRVAALREWRQAGSAARLGRNPWSYPLAPLFGGLAGNPAAAFGMLVIFAALAFGMALPRLKQKYGGLLGAGAGADPLGALTPPPAEGGDTAEDPELARIRKQLEDQARQNK